MLLRALALSSLLSCTGADGDKVPDGVGTDDDSDALTGCAAVDADDDGVDACNDCDDADPLVFPGATERCNGVDDDCDQKAEWLETDADSDGRLDCLDCETAGFWVPLAESPDADLAAAIALVTEGLDCDYSPARFWMFTELDNPDDTVECVYTGRKLTVTDALPDDSDMNTEHTWPRSWGAELEPAECDVNHLYPTDSKANGKRGNSPFGEVTGAVTWTEGGSTLGKDGTGTLVFEPRDVHKGNVARSMLYFSLQYGDQLTAEQLEEMLSAERKAIFKKWHQDDPVDARELERSLAIGAEWGSANPFVVCPGLWERMP